jgi:hypothetical protein
MIWDCSDCYFTQLGLFRAKQKMGKYRRNEYSGGKREKEKEDASKSCKALMRARRSYVRGEKKNQQRSIPGAPRWLGEARASCG